MKVYPPRDIRPFVMYCVNGKPRSSLLIESTDSMIRVFRAAVNTYVGVYIHVAAKNYEQARHTHTHTRDNHSNDNNKNYSFADAHTYIIESVDSISKDERGFPLTQYITNGRISRGGYTFTHFKHHHRVLRLISCRMGV